MVEEAAPVEVLIPEARHRQRRRYRRSAFLISIVALLVGALVALLILITSNGSIAARSSLKASVVVVSRPTVLIRPVLCFAWPYVANQKEGGALPPCAAPYQLTPAVLNVVPNPSVAGYSSNNPNPDPAFSGYPSSTGDSPTHTVLIQGLAGGPAVAQRFLLGPSEMRLSATDVKSASAHKNRIGQWVISMHLTTQGAAAFDRIAQENFHQFLAIDMGGKVVSAPLIQPTQASFSSFDGTIEISGALDRGKCTSRRGGGQGIGPISSAPARCLSKLAAPANGGSCHPGNAAANSARRGEARRRTDFHRGRLRG